MVTVVISAVNLNELAQNWWQWATTQLLQVMLRQLSQHNKGVVVPPQISVNSPMLASASPSSVKTTSAAAVRDVCSGEASTLSIPQGTI